MCCQQMILCVLLCLCVVCVPGCVCGFVLLCSCLSLSFFSKMCIDGMPLLIVFILGCQSIRTQVAALVTKRARFYEKLFKKGRKSTKCSDMSTSAPFIFTRIKFISIIGAQIPQKIGKSQESHRCSTFCHHQRNIQKVPNFSKCQDCFQD